MKKSVILNRLISAVSAFALLFNSFYVPLLLLSTSLSAPTDVVAANPSADLDQYANDDGDWVNGNLVASKATYFEGDSVPYRVEFDDLSLSSHTVTIEWDTTKNGKHALDYITSFDRTVSPDPCDGVTGCGSPSTFSIPADPQVTGAGVTPVPGDFTIYGGTINSVSSYSYPPNGTGFTGDNSAQLTITFTATQANPVLAWGGHIADRADWGEDNSAINISGSPYHTRVISLDGKSPGNQDRSLSAEAVIFPAEITIVKQADPEGSTEFDFTGDLGEFTLIDDGTILNTQVFDEITEFTTYDVTETVPTGWNLDSIECSDDSTTDTTTATANIDVEEGESVSCTFNNSLQNGTITVNKVTDPADDPTDFPISISGTGTVDGELNRTLTTSTPVVYEVTPGTYDVVEHTPDGWDQQSNTCSDVVVDPGEDESCTITNVEYGSITVDKVTDPSESDQIFTFNLGGDVTDSAELTDADSPHTFEDLLPGSYTLGEEAVEGWDLTDSYCENEIDPSDITLSAGQDLNCTFENTQRGSISGFKYEDQDGDVNTTDDLGPVENWVIELWKFVEDSFVYEDETTTDSSGFYEFTNLLSGIYEVREEVQSDWESLTDETLGVTVDPGESDEENNFTNTQLGSIRVLKDVDTDGDGVVDTAGSTDWTWKLGDDEYTTGDPAVSVSPDDYTISEVQEDGYHIVSLECSDEDPFGAVTEATVTVSSGEDVVCTFTNARDTGDILVHKYVDTNADGTYDVQSDTEANNLGFSWGFEGETLDKDFGDKEEGLVTGSYDVDEATASDYHFTGWFEGEGSCEDNNTLPATVTVSTDQTTDITICNTRDTGSITVLKNIDWDESGQIGDHDNDVEGSTDWTWDIENGEQDISTGDSRTLETGTYTITEDILEDYHIVGWSCDNDTSGETNSISVELGEESVTCTITNAPDTGSISGIKYEDADGDSSTTGDQTVVEGLLVRLWQWVDDQFVNTGLTDETDALGYYEFTGLVPGTYKVIEDLSSLGSDWISVDSTESPSIDIDPGEDEEHDFVNARYASITVNKNVDTDNDGEPDELGVTDWTWDIADGDQNISTGDTVDDLEPGTYRFREDQKEGYHVVGLTCSLNGEEAVDHGETANLQVTLDSNDDLECTFTNARDTGSLEVTKIIDVDGDPETTDDQTLGESWQFDVDGEEGDTSDPTAQSTDATGTTTFSDLKTGDYTVIETTQAGYDLVSASCDDGENGEFDGIDDVSGVSVDSEETTECTFINSPNGVIHGLKFHDENLNEEIDEGEDLLSGWTINLFKYDEDEEDYLPFDSFVTDDGDHLGWYWFENLFPGDYKVCEDLQTGWEQTHPSEDEGCHLITLPDDTSGNSINEELQNAVLGIAYDFGNVEYSEVLVTKYNDENGNGERDEGEDVLSGWTMNLNGDEYSESDETDEEGEALFENLLPGFYTLSENQQEGWILTNISCEEGEESQNQNEFFLSLNAGETTECEVGNQQLILGLSIDKTNDKTGGASAGETVNYTLTVENSGNQTIFGLDVIDVLPAGFTYVAGSTTGATTSDPTIVNGKLTWEDVDDLEDGDSLTINYQATIASDIDPAVYTNIATCTGDWGERVLSAFEEIEDPECNVDTSDVPIGTVESFSGELGGQVLGAQTELPAAGSETTLLYIFLGMIVGGLSLRIVAEDLEKKGRKNA